MSALIKNNHMFFLSVIYYIVTNNKRYRDTDDKICCILKIA